MAKNYPSSDWAKVPKGYGNKGSSGLYQTGAMCGHPLGAFLLFTMLGIPDGNADHFLRYFESTPLPGNEAYVDWRSDTWTPADPAKPFTSGDHPLNNGPKVRPGTVSCHGAHAKWKDASTAWIQMKGAGRANHDRCRKSTYTVQLKLVQMINDWKAGIPTPSTALDPSVGTCKTAGCHGPVPGQPESGYPASGVGGKMKCQPCHQTTAGITPNHGG